MPLCFPNRLTMVEEGFPRLCYLPLILSPCLFHFHPRSLCRVLLDALNGNKEVLVRVAPEVQHVLIE